MKERLLQLVGEELRLLRSEGVEGITLSDEALRFLEKESRQKVTSADRPQASAPKQAAPKQAAPKIQLRDPSPAPAKVDSGRPHLDSSLANPPALDIPIGSKEENWLWLRDRVLNCQVCQNHLNPGKRIVFGTGNRDADILFCGEAPGADEETQGEPFVGKAGELLTAMIKAMGLARDQVYITNIMNWRPQTGNPFGNRPPTDQEMAFCLPYLIAQIKIIQPKVIVALGATAAKGLLGEETKGRMARLRGQWKEFSNTPLMITYHPSFLLHQDSLASKRKVWEDLLAVMERLDMPISEKQRQFFLKALRN